MEELKPCPWCGQIPDIWEDHGWWYLECMIPTCLVMPEIKDGHPNEESITVAWNTRKETP